MKQSISFNAAEMPKVLDGSKTQTRRPVDEQPKSGAPVIVSPWEPGITAYEPGEFGLYREGSVVGGWGIERVLRCPWGKIRDVLVVNLYAEGRRMDMFDEHARVRVRLTDVRVEQLRGLFEISESDSIAEGATSKDGVTGYQHNHPGWSMDWSRIGDPGTNTHALTASDICLESARSAFLNYWESIYATKGKGIDTNPFCWALTFELVEPGEVGP